MATINNPKSNIDSKNCQITKKETRESKNINCNYCLQKITHRYYYEPVKLFSDLEDAVGPNEKGGLLQLQKEVSNKPGNQNNQGHGQNTKIAFHKCCLVCCICRVNLHQDYYCCLGGFNEPNLYK